MFRILYLIFPLIFSACSYDTSPKNCLEQGYKGVVISNIDFFFTGDACSNGILNPAGTHYLTTDGELSIQRYTYMEPK